MQVTLRPYQQQAVAEIRGSYQAGCRRALFVLPTGGGKTVVFTHIAERAAMRGSRICILVHRQELVDQSSRSLHAIGCNHGVIAAGYRQDLSHTVQVASVQTLARRLHQIPAGFFQLLIVDEAHHAVAGTWAKVLEHHQGGHVLGVTATPERLDGRGLGDQFETLIEGPDAGWLTEQGFLVPARVFAPPGIDLSGIKRFDTAKGRHEADDRLKQGQVMGDAVSHYRRTIQDEHNGTAIAFCCSVAHADALAEAFRSQGIAAARLDGAMDRGERRRMINDLGAGVLKVITSCDIISEGTDIPSVTGAILLRPTDSLGLHLQQVGRVLRPAPGKRWAIVNDHVGNSLRHGLPTDQRDWSLEGRQKGKRRTASEALPVKVCDSCFSTLPSAEPVCPICGFVFPAAARRELVTIEGTLQELTAQAAAQQRRQAVGRARTREELEVIRLERGYSRGWTDHILRARGGRSFG
jgi:superfamily II DNA or RNA helicase